MTINAYPLTWPAGWKRHASKQHGKFGKKASTSGTSWKHTVDLTINEALQRVLAELGRMGMRREDIIISSNLKLRLDGLPRSDQAAPADTGVAVYWEDGRGGHKVMAIDRYYKVADNLAAVAATLDAMRAIERHGGAVVLERAFTGFTALPAPGAAAPLDWREVLGLTGSPTAEILKAAWRSAAGRAHPDRAGGTDEAMAKVNAAYERARQELGL